MQLKDILELGVREGMRRYVEKRAGVLLPLAVGAMVPGIVHKAMERAHSTEEQIGHEPKLAGNMEWAGKPKGKPTGGPLDFSRFNPKTQVTPPKPAGPAGPSFLSQLFGGGKSTFGDSVKGMATSPLDGVSGGISGGISEMIKRKMLGHSFGEKKDPFSMGAQGAVSSFGKEMGTSGANLLRDIANKAMEAAGHAGDASARQAIIGDLKRTDTVLMNADDATLMEAYHTMSRFAPVLSTDKNAVRSFLRQAVMSGSGPDFMSIKLLADSERAVTGDKER